MIVTIPKYRSVPLARPNDRIEGRNGEQGEAARDSDKVDKCYET